MMGRETKILLALLGTLSSGFVGVLGSKLFVPRPPDGAGPDVHLPAHDHADGPIVEPPSFDRLGRSIFSATDATDATDAEGDRTANTLDSDAPAASLAAADDAGSGLLEPPTFWQTDPPVEPDGLAAGEGDDAGGDPLTTDEAGSGLPEAGGFPAADEDLLPPPAVAVDSGEVVASGFESAPGAVLAVDPPGRFTPPSNAMPISAGSHLVTDGDTWWSIAERAYGDGRLYKPLFAWNRALDPRVSLAPGTRLEVPPINSLVTAHAGLLPKDLAGMAGPAAVVQTSATELVGQAGMVPNGRSIVVREGDTLISIAREQLGSSSRWRELYEANRETLGRSPGPLTPGTQLVVP